MTSTASHSKKAPLVVATVVIGLAVGVWGLGRAIHMARQEARRTRLLRESQVTAPETGYRFPAHSEIARMTLADWNRADHRDVPPFDVPEGCWDEIIASLSPSQYDPQPCPWQVLGHMEIRLKKGDTRQFGLYNLGPDASWPDEEVIGAFSTGPTGSREYYRGGYTSKLKAAMRRAYSEYQKRAKPVAAEGHHSD